MKDYLLFLFFIVSKFCLGQDVSFDTITKIDTILLKEFHAKRIVAFEIENIFILLDRKSFIKDYKLWSKDYKRSRINIKENSHNIKWNQRSLVLDSIYKVLKNSHDDTIHISNMTFDQIDWVCVLYIARNAIEKGDCSIIDINGKVQNKIIKKTGIMYKRRSDPYGGLKYYFQNKKNPFLSITTWVS